MIFVFGSNEAGIHGAGAAAFAYKKRGARWGFSYGHIGDSFAIPTKAASFNPETQKHFVSHTLRLGQIKQYVEGFIAYAKGHPELEFQVTCIGCGLAGLRDEDVAPMFEYAPINCLFDTKWEHLLPKGCFKFWGTF